MSKVGLRGVGETAHKEMGRSGGNRINLLISNPRSFHNTMFSEAFGGLRVEGKKTRVSRGFWNAWLGCRLLLALPGASCRLCGFQSAGQPSVDKLPIAVSPRRLQGLNCSPSQPCRIYSDFLHSEKKLSRTIIFLF